MVAAPGASATGVWRQGVPKPANVECEDLNGYLFAEGSVPVHLQPIYSADATTEWSESWSSAEWAGGAICIREVTDPSCVAQGGCPEPQRSRQPAPAPSPTYSQLTGAVFAGTSISWVICQPGESIGTLQDLTSYPTWNTGFPYSSATGVLTMTNNTSSDGVFTLDYRCI